MESCAWQRVLRLAAREGGIKGVDPVFTAGGNCNNYNTGDAKCKQYFTVQSAYSLFSPPPP